MLCLFRNSHIHPRLDPAAIAISLAATLWWLYFAFIEKDLMSKISSGQALIVDLVFGLPLVLALAVMVYATVYWSLKLLLVLFFPKALVAKPEEIYELQEDEVLDSLEEEQGKEYWQSENSKEPKPSQTSSKPQHHPKKEVD